MHRSGCTPRRPVTRDEHATPWPMAIAARLGVVLALILVVVGCVAPVRWSGPARPPDEHIFVGRHGRPLAYGGGVCPVEPRHFHKYKGVPKAAFVDDKGAFRDTRAIYPYHDPHPHHRRTCFLARRHYHLEPPRDDLFWSSSHGAYAKVGDVPAATHLTQSPQPR